MQQKQKQTNNNSSSSSSSSNNNNKNNITKKLQKYRRAYKNVAAAKAYTLPVAQFKQII
jgi:hypothetical protein